MRPYNYTYRLVVRKHIVLPWRLADNNIIYIESAERQLPTERTRSNFETTDESLQYIREVCDNKGLSYELSHV